MTAPVSPTTWQSTPAGASLLPKRPVPRSLARGFRCRCPQCGKGALFRGYLKVRPNCPSCGEDMSHQRADDAPPYFTMVIVGHLVVPVMLTVQFMTNFPTAWYLAFWLPFAAILTFSLLRPVKGATVALQWALYMHGFDGSADPDAVPAWAHEHAGPA